MNWQDLGPNVFFALVGVCLAWSFLVGWWRGRKARRVLAESLDHPIRPSEDVSLSAWMHVPDQRLEALSEDLKHNRLGPLTWTDRSAPDIEPQSLVCPRDLSPLAPQLIGSARFYVCARCGGMWVSDPELQTFLASPEVDLGFMSLKIPAAATSGRPELARNTVRCLCAHAPFMRTKRRLGAHVDVCPECGAVWLDGGELLHMSNSVSQSQNNTLWKTLAMTLSAGR